MNHIIYSTQQAWLDSSAAYSLRPLSTTVSAGSIVQRSNVGWAACMAIRLVRSFRTLLLALICENKGALILRFIYDDTSLCLVNCHLAAGQSQTLNRNNDAAAILESTMLPGECHSVTRCDTYIGGGDGSMILDHEICVLKGDLNYRIDTMGRDTVIKAISNNNFEKLLERDQLLVSRRRNPGFRLRAFTESMITFAPTYKYDVGSDKYDTSEKHRAPAWCDRILYRGASKIKQIQYRRHETRVSDHRPVSGTFKMRIKSIQPENRSSAWKDSVRRFEEIKQKLFSEAKYVLTIQVLKPVTADIALLLLGLPTFEIFSG